MSRFKRNRSSGFPDWSDIKPVRAVKEKGKYLEILDTRLCYLYSEIKKKNQRLLILCFANLRYKSCIRQTWVNLNR